MNLKLFFKLTKFGWINLFYAPILSLFISVNLQKTNNLDILFCYFFISFLLLNLYFFFIYKSPYIKYNSGFDFLIIPPLIYILFLSILKIIYISPDSVEFITINSVCVSIASLYGLHFALDNFLTYPRMKKDYKRIEAMLKLKYKPSVLTNLEKGSPCEQSVANDLRSKYDINRKRIK